MKRIALTMYMLTAAQVVYAHDHWADGSSVPDAIKNRCCGVADAHHIPYDQVKAVKGGYQIVGDTHTMLAGMPPLAIRPGLVPYDRVESSPDGEWWVFYGTENPDYIYCVFGPGVGT